MGDDMPHDPKVLAWLAKVADALEEVGSLEYCGEHYWVNAAIHYGQDVTDYRVLLSGDLDCYAVEIGGESE